jgi:phosphoglycolate phosphatase-like HAD superfamily hydrolase
MLHFQGKLTRQHAIEAHNCASFSISPDNPLRLSNRTLADYLSFYCGDGEAIYDSHRCRSIREADAIVFDFDGTLVDSRSSLVEAIITSTQMLFGLTCHTVVEKGLLEKALYDLSKTGGFNSPLDAVYSLFLGLVTSLSDERIERLTELLSGQSMIQSLSDFMLKLPGSHPKDELESCLDDVVQYADVRGTVSVEEGIDRLYREKRKRNHIESLKRVLSYRSVVPFL